MTPSAPVGIWRIDPLAHPVSVGDLVFVCPPVTDRMREARLRGYLRSGLCPGSTAPLIKTIEGVAGQFVEVDRLVRIDGRILRNSRLQTKDGRQRPLQPYAGGRIPPGQAYLHSSFTGSFDSRYFGPIPVENVIGQAREVITHAP